MNVPISVDSTSLNSLHLNYFPVPIYPVFGQLQTPPLSYKLFIHNKQTVGVRVLQVLHFISQLGRQIFLTASATPFLLVQSELVIHLFSNRK